MPRGSVPQISDRAWWAGSPEKAPPIVSENVRLIRRYIEIHDGIRLAANIYLPADLPPDEKLPSLVSFTPYFREVQFRVPGISWLVGKLDKAATNWGKLFAQYGYAYLLIEIQGAGASFGTKTSLFSDQLVRDGADVLDWIVAQPWSNGLVGTTGISALGLTGEMMAPGNHPALKAIAPRFTSFDIFNCIHPGGLLQARFVDDIGAKVRAMDSNRMHEVFDSPVVRAVMRVLLKGLRAVDEDTDGSLLAAALKQHEDNEAFDRDLATVLHRDDLFTHSARPARIDDQSPSGYFKDIDASGVAVYSYDGWYDGTFHREMIHLHLNMTNPRNRLVLGPWAHRGAFYSTPWHPSRRVVSEFDQAAELVRFFDPILRGTDYGIDDEPPVHYFTMVEERWKSSDNWPPAGTTTTRLYLGEEGSLVTEAPSKAGIDFYVVDPTATTGVWSRHGKHLSGGSGGAVYGDRREADAKLLCYTSAPLSEAVEVTGHPMVTLSMTCDTPDAALFVYLEDVAPDGRVDHVTEAELRLSFRKLGSESPYTNLGVWRRGNAADTAPVVPGEIMELPLDLLPISWLFRKGHAIRITIAGADIDNFVTVPEEGPPPTFGIHRGSGVVAHVDLPVMPGPSDDGDPAHG